MSELRSRALRGSFITLAGQGIRFCTQAVALLLLSRLLPVAAFGQFAQAFTITGVAAIIGDFGFSLASVQRLNTTYAQKSNLFALNIAIGASIVAGLEVVAGPIASFYHSPETEVLIRVTAPIFLLTSLGSQHRAELERRMRFSQLTVVDVSAQLLGLAAGVIWAAASPTAWALVTQQMTVATVTCAGVWLRSEWRPCLPQRRQEMSFFLKYGVNTTAGQLTTYLAGMSDSIVVGRFDSTDTLGSYSRMSQLFSLPLQQLAAPLTRVALPTLAVALARSHESFLRYLRSAQIVLSWLFLPLLVGMVAQPQAVVEILLGVRYTEGATVLRLLAIGGSFQSMGYVYYWAFLATGRMDIQFRLGLVSRSVGVALIVASGPFGVEWTAAAAAGTLALNWITYTVFGVPRVGVGDGLLLWPALRAVLVCATAGAQSVVIVRGLLPHTEPLVAIAVYVLCLTATATLAAALSRTLRHELMLIYSIPRLAFRTQSGLRGQQI